MRMARNRKFFWHYMYLLTIVLIGFLVLTVVLQRKTEHSFIEHNKMILTKTGNLLVQTFDASIFANRQLAEQYAEKTASESDFRITFIRPDGSVLADSSSDPAAMDSHHSRPEILAAANDSIGVSMRFSDTEQKHFLYAAFRVDEETTEENTNEEAGFFRLSIPVETAFKTAENLSITIVISGVIIFLSLSSISFLSVRHINRAVSELRRAAEEYKRGNLDYKIYVDGPLEISVLSSTMNEMSHNLGKLMDTVVRKSDEQEVILTSMTEAVVALDHHLCIKSINRAGEKLLGNKFSSITGKGILDVFRNTELYQFAADVLQGNALPEIFLSLYRIGNRTEQLDAQARESEVMYLQVHGSPISLHNKSENGVLLVLNDITRLKLLEKIRKEFIANVSHELKTPITSIKGFVETLKTIPIENKEKSEQFLSIIENQTDRLGFIIDDLLIVSRLEQTPEIGIEKNPNSVAKLMEQAVESCRREAEEKKLDIIMKSDGDVQIVANERLIVQAVINLLDNAIKYSDKPGRITLSSALVSEKKVKIAVTDQGRGIPQASLSRIFERFYRVDKARSRDEGGTGLGLSIVKHIALVHGGEVLVESEIGKGSVFSLVLPR